MEYTSRLVDAAVTAVEKDLERRLSAALELLPRQARLLDELDRIADDTHDESLRRQLNRAISQLDDERHKTGSALASVATYDLLDPLRTLAIDIRHGLL